MRKKLAIIGAVLCLCAVALGVLALFVGPPRLHSKARKQWKDNAIAEIAKQTSNTAPILKQIEAMKTKPSTESEWDTWISDNLIVMTNGQWMAYRNVCAKEKERIPDLFLGCGSDGRWYYSTYHFCIRMIVLKDMLGQPESLAHFVQQGFLREFDSHSDECLKQTWPLKR